MASCREAARKETEKPFGVLKGTWPTVNFSSRFWTTNRMKYIMEFWIIMHNMVLECGYKNNQDEDSVLYQDVVSGETVYSMRECNIANSSTLPPSGSIAAVCSVARFMRNEVEYFKMRELLMNNFWDHERRK